MPATPTLTNGKAATGSTATAFDSFLTTTRLHPGKDNRSEFVHEADAPNKQR